MPERFAQLSGRTNLSDPRLQPTLKFGNPKHFRLPVYWAIDAVSNSAWNLDAKDGVQIVPSSKKTFCRPFSFG